MDPRLVDEGGDWDRRNRLKAYQGLHLLSIRNFKLGGALLLDTVTTFTATELIDYDDFVTLCVLAGVLTLERKDLKKKVRVILPDLDTSLMDLRPPDHGVPRSDSSSPRRPHPQGLLRLPLQVRVLDILQGTRCVSLSLSSAPGTDLDVPQPLWKNTTSFPPDCSPCTLATTCAKCASRPTHSCWSRTAASR